MSIKGKTVRYAELRTLLSIFTGTADMIRYAGFMAMRSIFESTVDMNSNSSEKWEMRVGLLNF